MAQVLRIGVEELREVPAPSPEQRERFLRHVAGAHSWYRSFQVAPGLISMAVFLWRGQPRSAGDQEQLGFLTYGWRTGADYPFSVDRSAPVELAPELLAAAQVEVEAYVSSDFWVTSGCIASSDPARIAAHPRRHALEQLVAARNEMRRRWGELPAEVRAGKLPEEATPDAPPGVAEYLTLQREHFQRYRALNLEELAKLDVALDRVLALRERLL